MANDSDQPFDLEQGSRDETVRLLSQGQRIFGRYILTKVIGRGGMGVVWLARDEELDRNVALKFLPESVAHDQEAAAELKRETRRSLELTHPNIVRIHDFVHDETRAAIAMEYIDGRTVSALKAGRDHQCFGVTDIAHWVQQLCAALDYAHRVGLVIHQDLKPANLMVNSKGQLKVTDFGIARSISDSVTRITAEDTVGGTLVYMSPQQLNGEKPSPLNDIYSLGATLYDLLTGKPPFYTGSLHHQIQSKIPPSIAERRKDFNFTGNPVPESWESTILACLAKDPADRPASAAEVASRMGLHTSDPEAAWMTKLPGIPGTKPGRKFTLGRMLAATALSVGLLIGVLFLTFSKPARLRNQPAVTAPSPPINPGTAAPPAMPLQPPAPLETLGNRFTNSLGMVFTEVKPGELFVSIWETRVRDFAAFADATGYNATQAVVSLNEAGEFGEFGRHWKDPGWEQSGDHPVAGMSRSDAMMFTRWLTETETARGGVPEGFEYRLPTDVEWSFAAGLEMETGTKPVERNGKVPGIYPWGNAWPPPPEAGNYALGDDHHFTAPVASHAPNSFGLYDLGGNLWEWCQDIYDESAPLVERRGVLRGGSYLQGPNNPDAFLSSTRRDPTWSKPAVRNLELGFRCVLARKPGIAPTANLPAVTAAVPDLGTRFTNQLGMVLARIDNLYWSIWETRVGDFSAFVDETGYNATADMYVRDSDGEYRASKTFTWKNPSFAQTAIHPVIGLSRDDTEAFCEWLTLHERKLGTLPEGCRYRLPTDLEWSHAAGLEFEPGATPADRDGRISGVYPWGRGWPPPERAGNYLDHGDAYPETAPVGSFRPNQFGLFDMGGNAWEWCSDWYDSSRQTGVLRGGSFRVNEPELMIVSGRNPPANSKPAKRNFTFGFRCVLALDRPRNAANAH